MLSWWVDFGFMAFFLLNLFDYVDYHAALFAYTRLKLSLIYYTENLLDQSLVQLIAFIYSILHMTTYASVF